MSFYAEGTVIILEHDGGLRALARRVLGGQAFRALEARNAAEAFELAESTEASDTVDLLICDVDTPRLRARSLAMEMGALHPGMAVLFTSARSDQALLASGFDIGNDPFLQRPFNGTQLMDAVRSALRVEAVVSLD